MDHYRYFAASIFWRASAGKWNDTLATIYHAALGSKYQEQLRRFLLGSQQFPSKALLVYFVDNESSPLRDIVFPTYRNDDGYHLHEFAYPGVSVRMLLGGMMPVSVQALASSFRSNTIFVLHDSRKFSSHAKLLGILQSSKRKGKMERLFPG